MGLYTEEYLQESSMNVPDAGYIEKKADLELLKKYAKEIDISPELEQDFLHKLSDDLDALVKADDQTRKDWLDSYNEALKIAKQLMTRKDFPFENAADIKIPLILQACVQFNSRIMPEFIRNDKTVHIDIIGKCDEKEEESADRLSNHMSLQTLKVMDNWVSDTDKLLSILPLVGTVFRKTTYDPIARKPASCICMPTEIIVSNDISSLSQAERITHVFRLSRNEVVERIRFGIFNKDCLNGINLDENEIEVTGDINYASNSDDEKELSSEVVDSRDKLVFHEICCWLDLDSDGYCEPYTVTRCVKNKQIARIAPRFDENSFVLDSSGSLVRINALEFYSAHILIPAPDGTFLGMGFGQMLLHLNKTINTIVNQLVDAGTLSNIQGGFVSKDLRIKKGELQMNAGKWEMVNHTAGSGPLSNYFFPLPFKEPSQTLMALLTFLTDFGKQTASINDVLMGNPVNANMPATSVVSLIEQGSKVFASILSRLYESFKKEFSILFNLNKKYFNLYPEKDLMTKSGYVSQEDYNNDKFNIYPVANPAMGLDAVRLAKLQALMQVPVPNEPEKLRMYLSALGFSSDHLKKLFTPPPSQPSPQDLLVQAQIEELKARTQELGMRSAKIMRDGDLEAVKIGLEELKAKIDAAFKGGQLAIGKANAVAAITSAESRAAGNQSAEAVKIVDQEVPKSQINEDFSGLDAQINKLQNPQNNSNLQPNSGGANMGAESMPNSSMSIQNAPNLPPELSQQLQQMAASQQ